MKLEVFVDQPTLDFKVGIKVTPELELSYKSEKVEQTLKDCVLHTVMDEEGTNGINTYRSHSHLEINLNPGDILLFDADRGYYMPPYPVTSIDDAISDISSLESVPREVEME